MSITVNLTRQQEKFVKSRVKSGRYLDESDLIRDALRALESREEYEDADLEAAILEGARGRHRPYGQKTLDRVRALSRRLR